MQTYTIKEVSEKFNIPQSTLRYYEDLGILSKVERTSSNKRIYSEENINKLNAINCFKNGGMSLPQIKKFFDYEQDEYSNIDDMLILLEEQKVNVEIQLDELKMAYIHIKNKVRFYKAVKEALDNNDTPPKWVEFNE